MKTFLIVAVISVAVFVTACNSGGDKSESVAQEPNSTNKDTPQHATMDHDKEVKAVAVTFTNIDAKVTAAIQAIVGHYLHVKNALANDDSKEAANASKEMATAIDKLDKSLLTAEQKKVYDENQDDLKEHAEHIGKNADNIKHQRGHFVGMSEEIYALVKSFGAGRPMYHDHCPMAQDNKGAMWISETKEIKNPYFGAQMPKCGSVEEVIQ